MMRSDQMLTGLMSVRLTGLVSLFYRYFCNLWKKKSHLRKTNCPVRCYTVFIARTLPIVCANAKRRNYEHAACEIKCTVPINHITTACVSWEGFAWRYDIHSIQEQFPCFINHSCQYLIFTMVTVASTTQKYHVFFSLCVILYMFKWLWWLKPT